MFGDTHVDPDKLFDPATDLLPGDALDVYFPVPTSLSLFGDALARTPDMAHLVPTLAEAYGRVLTRAVRDLQRSSGYVEHPTRGPLTAARLAITVISENAVPGESIMRLHGHLYVGRYAPAIADGQVCPVNLTRFRQGIDNVVWGNYANRLEQTTAEAFGLVWGPLPGHHPGDQEIVDPPFAPHVGQHAAPDVAVCPGRYGPRERIMADQQWRIGIAESQVRVQSEQRWAG